MITLKTWKGPANRRNLPTQNYHTAFAMDWLKEYDGDKEESGYQKAVEPEEDHYSLLTSSSNHNSIDNVFDCNLMNNLRYDTNNLSGDREGIG